MQPECKDSWFARNPFACLPNSHKAFRPRSAPKSFHPSLSIVRLASSHHDDLPSRPTTSPHSPSGSRPTTSPHSRSATHPTSVSLASFNGRAISNISPATAPELFLRVSSLSDSPLAAAAPPLCPVCDVVSAKSCFDCEQQFCASHIYSCADCGNLYCGDCLDAHHADGHWTDSDTAFELASSRRVARSSSANLLDLPPSGRAPESISLCPESATSHQPCHSSWPAIPDTLKLLLSFLLPRLTFAAKSRTLQSGAAFSRLLQRLMHVAAPRRFMVQYPAFHPEASS